MRLAVDVETFTARLAPDAAAVVVASHGRDEVGVLAAALRAEVPYVALVASPRRATGVLAELAASGVAATDCARVRAPAGLDIGARTPGEIALSIYAEALLRGSAGAGPSSPGPSAGSVPSVGSATSAADPVCGMMVAPVAASLHVEQAGATVWFCGPGCRQAFLADPARYAR